MYAIIYVSYEAMHIAIVCILPIFIFVCVLDLLIYNDLLSTFYVLGSLSVIQSSLDFHILWMLAWHFLINSLRPSDAYMRR